MVAFGVPDDAATLLPLSNVMSVSKPRSQRSSPCLGTVAQHQGLQHIPVRQILPKECDFDVLRDTRSRQALRELLASAELQSSLSLSRSLALSDSLSLSLSLSLVLCGRRGLPRSRGAPRAGQLQHRRPQSRDSFRRISGGTGVRGIFTHVLPLAEIQEAFTLASECLGQEGSFCVACEDQDCSTELVKLHFAADEG